jgi:predicted transcriptional regulator
MTEYKLQVNLPADIGKLIEEIASRRLMSRSAYARQALLLALEKDGVCIAREKAA